MQHSIEASVAALSFGCARAIEQSTNAKDEYCYAGERFFHAALMLLTASIIKYAAISIQAKSGIIAVLTGSMAGMLFFWALNSSHAGLLVLNNLLWTRFNRHPKWDSIL